MGPPMYPAYDASPMDLRLYRDPDPRVRPDAGTCPGCGADEKRWCRDGCELLDRKDYR